VAEEHEPTSTVGAVASVGRALVSGLPAQFLALVAMNTVFIIALLMFLDHQNSSREHMMSKFIDSCALMQTPGRDK
jgi:hypothetical protein